MLDLGLDSIFQIWTVFRLERTVFASNPTVFQLIRTVFPDYPKKTKRISDASPWKARFPLAEMLDLLVAGLLVSLSGQYFGDTDSIGRFFDSIFLIWTVFALNPTV
ncbi:hypothetical protein FQ085_03010 [Planococcus sp. ANT_H30]|uniref:hypothetical protein n=1 Tax=Planococcus sp. ANT_H30 TaxID=2597347 RepID=UPI0011F07FCA|nr:hypothetical protein [Planococcus sp. ANT_H30]KAA0958705.1 hypothetical protein FQ085_03010 [Planococcus sp. ANT_H30]